MLIILSIIAIIFFIIESNVQIALRNSLSFKFIAFLYYFFFCQIIFTGLDDIVYDTKCMQGKKNIEHLTFWILTFLKCFVSIYYILCGVIFLIIYYCKLCWYS